MIADLQSERMDEQRAQLPGLVTSNQSRNGRPINSQPSSNFPRGRNTSDPAPDDAFLDMLMRSQSSRLEEQRSELPRPNVTSDAEQGEAPINGNRRVATSNAGATVPDEDFFSLIMRVQGGRMEDQRAAVNKNFDFSTEKLSLIQFFFLVVSGAIFE